MADFSVPGLSDRNLPITPYFNGVRRELPLELSIPPPRRAHQQRAGEIDCARSKMALSILTRSASKVMSTTAHLLTWTANDSHFSEQETWHPGRGASN